MRLCLYIRTCVCVDAFASARGVMSGMRMYKWEKGKRVLRVCLRSLAKQKDYNGTKRVWFGFHINTERGAGFSK